MTLGPWEIGSSRAPLPAWLRAWEPATTGLLAQEGLKLWHAGDRAAVGLKPGGPAYPVLPDPWDPALGPGLRAVLDRLPDLWCLMGPAAWVERAEAHLPPSRVSHRVAYDFLVRPAAACPDPGGVGDPRRARESDLDALMPLQEAYEKEEVLFNPEEFQALASRLHLGWTLRHQETWALWEAGRPTAKAGTNALTRDWAQIGGVFTRPEARRGGRQRRLMAVLVDRLAASGRGACLFVKTGNAAARNLYLGLGFHRQTGYTITYGERSGRFALL